MLSIGSHPAGHGQGRRRRCEPRRMRSKRAEVSSWVSAGWGRLGDQVMTRCFRLTLAAIVTLALAPAADARVTKIQITMRESPTFGGYSFSDVGPYEKIVGKAFGELDPHDPKNAVIVELKLAPRNRNGNVEYLFDFYILKPIDLSKGAHKVMYEPPNRGS